MKLSLSPERWQQAQRLFDEVADLDLAARTARLDDACRDDPSLREAVEMLLEADSAADDRLERFDRLAQASPLQAGAPSSRTGSTVGHYEVLEKLGSGGMGVVYKARDVGLKREVALKFLPPHLHANPEARQRFEHEAQAASALDHPNICTIHEIGETGDGHLFMAMSFYRGETLKQKIGRGALPVGEALDYAAQIARGLAAAHSAGVVHRDVKPANLIIVEPSSASSGGLVKILDFGLAKMADVQLTRTGTTMGTVSYMSPEQARGEKVDQRTDVWSLGVILYEMLTGERPFTGAYDQAIVNAILHEAPQPLAARDADLPEDVKHIVMMCLEKERQRRYQTTPEVLDDLEQVAGRTGVGSRTRLRATKHRRARMLKRGVLAGAALLLAFMLAWSGPSIWQAMRGEAASPALHLAVLSFESEDPGETNEAFSEGLRLTLTNVLTEMRHHTGASLQIVSASEVGDIKTAAEARQTFGVSRVLTGRVRQESDRVSLDLTLTDAETLLQLRSIDITEDPGETETLQEQIVAGLAEILEIDLTPQARRALAMGGTADSRAYDFYLKGSAYLTRFEQPENIDTAISLFEFALEEDSTYALAHAGLGEAYWRKYQVTRDTLWVGPAEASCRRALALEDQLIATHLTLGLIYNGTGADADAVRAYTLAIALDSTRAEAYRGRGRAFEGLDRTAEAEADYLKAIALQPDRHLPHLNLGVMYLNLGRFEDAVVEFQRIIELTPDNAWGHNNLGAAYLYLQRWQEAREAFERLIEIEPTAYAYSNLGYIAYVEGRHEDEVHVYEQALALDSLDYVIWGNLASAYQRAFDDSTKAIGHYRRAIRLAEAQVAVNPNDPGVLADLAGYHQEMKQFTEALFFLEKALAIDPENVRLMFTAGLIYEAAHDRDKALEWIGKALENGYPLDDVERTEMLDSLRLDPRYQPLRNRVALPS